MSPNPQFKSDPVFRTLPKWRNMEQSTYTPNGIYTPYFVYATARTARTLRVKIMSPLPPYARVGIGPTYGLLGHCRKVLRMGFRNYGEEASRTVRTHAPES